LPDGIASQRLNLVPGVSIYTADRTIDHRSIRLYSRRGRTGRPETLGRLVANAPVRRDNPPAARGSFGRITSIVTTGAVGTGAPRRIDFMFRAEF